MVRYEFGYNSYDWVGKRARWTVALAVVAASAAFGLRSFDVSKNRGLESRVDAPVAVVENVLDVNEGVVDVNENVSVAIKEINDSPNRVSENAIYIIKFFEGFGDKPYWDIKHWAIGYGHGMKSREECSNITRGEALNLLKSDLKSIEKAVAEYVEVPINQNQYDALCSFTYNFNESDLRRSTLLNKLNNSDYSGAAKELHRWVHKINSDGTKEVLPGLVKRRKAEYDLFMKKN